MSRRWHAFVLLVLLAFLVPGTAQAYRFGTDETIHKIEDVKLKGKDDEALFLGYMTRTRNFLAGLYLEDVGYVLGVQGNSKRFYHMPEGEELKRFQQNGLLPNPLPPYSISALDYLFGYLLWLVLAGVGLYMLVSSRRKSNATAEQAAPGTQAPPPGGPPA